jgi:hypothetical protein
MMNRDVEIITLRPTIALELVAELPLEKFQNEVLRPILKLQHELLIATFKRYCYKRKEVFFRLSDKDKWEYIDQAVRKDMKFKHYLEGIISGLFTVAEYEQFMENEEELTKRMINLMVQRLQSQLLLLTK